MVVGIGIINDKHPRELNRCLEYWTIHLIKKKNTGAEHSSDRNSGLLHASFYYAAISFKAKFNLDGNGLLIDYCVRNKIAINQFGKLLVVLTETEFHFVDKLLWWQEENNIDSDVVSRNEAKIKPHVENIHQAFFPSRHLMYIHVLSY